MNFLPPDDSVEIDDDDWVDLEKSRPAQKVLSPVFARMTVWGKQNVARAGLYFRFEYAKWLEDNGPRFKVQIGGAGTLRAGSAHGREEVRGRA